MVITVPTTIIAVIRSIPDPTSHIMVIMGLIDVAEITARIEYFLNPYIKK
jgi:hypothetical protein